MSDQGESYLAQGCTQCGIWHNDKRIRPAFVIVERYGHRYWTCPMCSGSYGEVSTEAPGGAAEEFRIALHEWAVAGWRSEVQNRPLVNIHRKRLDDFWRHALRKAGGDPDTIFGHDHATLVEIESMRANVATPRLEVPADSTQGEQSHG